MNSQKKPSIPLEKITNFFAWISGALILFAAVLVSLDILAREVFSDNLFESYEISIYIFAITVAFSYAYALTTKTSLLQIATLDLCHSNCNPSFWTYAVLC